MNARELRLHKQTPATPKMLMRTHNPKLATNKLGDLRFSFLLSVISLAHKFLVNTQHQQAVFSSYRITVITISMVATQRRHMALQTRCIANVIKPFLHRDRARLTIEIDNGTPGPKYEH
jgi:hypothetical protein